MLETSNTDNSTAFLLGLSNWLKTKLEFCTKILLYSNLKGIISVFAFVFSPEATRGRTEQNITNACFFKAIK